MNVRTVSWKGAACRCILFAGIIKMDENKIKILALYPDGVYNKTIKYTPHGYARRIRLKMRNRGYPLP